MKNLKGLLITLFIMHQANAQDTMYYNPDIDGNFEIATPDLIGLLPLFGSDFVPVPLQAITPDDGIQVVTFTEEGEVQHIAPSSLVVVRREGSWNCCAYFDFFHDSGAVYPDGFRSIILNDMDSIYTNNPSVNFCPNGCYLYGGSPAGDTFYISPGRALEFVHYSGRWYVVQGENPYDG